MGCCDLKTPLAEGRGLLSQPVEGTLVLNTTHLLWIQQSHDWMSTKGPLSAALSLIHWNCREISSMPAAWLYLGLQIFMTVDQFIIVYYLKKEVWGFESYTLSGTPCFLWNYFVWSLRFFFLVVHLNIIWHPCPLRRWITPVRGAKIGEVMFTILSLDLIGIIGRVSTVGKGWYVLTCVY